MIPPLIPTGAYKCYYCDLFLKSCPLEGYIRPNPQPGDEACMHLAEHLKPYTTLSSTISLRDSRKSEGLPARATAKQALSVAMNKQDTKVSNGACPDCGCTLWFQEGCVLCEGCGYTVC